MALEDSVENVLDGLVDLGSVADSSGSLENTGTLDILVNNGSQVLGLPERILLKPNLKVLVEDGDEGDGLLATAVHEKKEVSDIFSGEELGLGQGVGVDELLSKLEGDIQLGVGLNDRVRLDTDEAFLNAAENVAQEVAVRVVDPALLVLDEKQLHETVDDFLVSHILQVSNTAVGLLTEPDLCYSEIIIIHR